MQHSITLCDISLSGLEHTCHLNKKPHFHETLICETGFLFDLLIRQLLWFSYNSKSSILVCFVYTIAVPGRAVCRESTLYLLDSLGLLPWLVIHVSD